MANGPLLILFLFILLPFSQGLKQSIGPLIFGNLHQDIRMIRLDAPRIESTVIIAEKGEPYGLNFYYKEQIIFWTDTLSEKIKSYRLNDTSKKALDVIKSGLSFPNGLACDWVTKKLYWTDSGTKRIEVSQFDGKNRKVLFWQNVDKPAGIALIPQEGLVFWTDFGVEPRIERASMDGQKRRVIIRDGLARPNGLAIDFDAKRIYWVDGHLKYISSADYDGSNRKELASKFTPAYGLTLAKDILFVTEGTAQHKHNNSISSCNKGTGHCKVLLPVLKNRPHDLQPLDIKVFSPILQPENSTACNINNGGCSHLCLLSSEPPYYSCACPTGIILTDDNKTCAQAEEKFIIVLGKTDIRKVSLDTEDHNDVVLEYKGIKNAIAVDYDPIERRIYWTDSDAKAIRKAFLNSTRWENFSSIDIYHPGGIAVDWISRNLYWTDAGSKTIQVSRLDGSHRKTIISVNLDEVRAIAINPWKGYMFWTDWGSDPKIERSALDGTLRQKIISEDVVWPNGLAIDIDGDRIFWCDAGMHRIESSNLDGKSRKILLDNVSRPFGLTIFEDHVYWTDWGTHSIHRIHKLGERPAEIILHSKIDMMGLKAINLHQNLSLQKKTGCQKSNGLCKHLCLERPNNTPICACANGWELERDGKGCKKTKNPPKALKSNRKTKVLQRTDSIKNTCSSNQFACISGKIDCVSASHRCDGDSDCTDDSDEINCPCLDDKMICPSDPRLCLDLATICGRDSPCPDVGFDILKLCPKAHFQPNQVINANHGLPILGVSAAGVILAIIFLCAYKMRDNSPEKELPVGIPLMPPSSPFNANGSDNGPLIGLQPSVSPPVPDLLGGYANISPSNQESSSLYENESDGRLYPLNPPPSPATVVSRNSFFHSSVVSAASIPSAPPVSCVTESSFSSKTTPEHSKHRRKKCHNNRMNHI